MAGFDLPSLSIDPSLAAAANVAEAAKASPKVVATSEVVPVTEAGPFGLSKVQIGLAAVGLVAIGFGFYKAVKR